MRDERIKALRGLLDDDPNDAFALYGLAMDLKAIDDSDTAIELLQRLLVVEPEHLYGHYQLGELLIADGENEEAEQVLERGIEHAIAAGDTKAASELRGLTDLL